ncbi:hypothetical protein ACHWQZ_G015002 [Mnemiopsis leidyi]
MNVAVLILLVYLIDIVKLQGDCLECTDSVTTACYATCDQTINIALGDTIYQLPIRETINSALSSIKFEGTSFISLSSNPKTNSLYLSTEDSIHKVDISDERPTKKLVTKNFIHHPTGIDVDSATNNIYWTDHSVSSIYVTDGTQKTTLMVLPPENLPFDLVIDPTRPGFFWSEPYSGKVMYAGLDGSGVTNISTGLDFPSGICVDPITGILAVMTLGEESRVPDTVIQISPFCGQTDCAVSKQQIRRAQPPISKMAYLACVPGEGFVTASMITQEEEVGVMIYKVENSGRIDQLPIFIAEAELEDVPAVSISSYKLSPLQDNPCYNSLCEYMCVNSTTCLCQDGYHLREDGRSCSKGTQTLLYTDQLSVVAVDLESNSEAVLELGDDIMQVGVGIDFDQLTNTVYWSDIRYSQIVKAKVGEAPVVVRENIGHPAGVSIDWVTKYIYFVDDLSNSLRVLSNDGTDMAVLATFGESPRSVKVDPINGFVFWSDRSNNAMIIRSKLSGDQLTVIANLTEQGSQPNGVALDIANKMVYWIDGYTDQIMGTEYEGGTMRTILYLPDSQGFSLSILDGYFYWSDWQQKRIGKIAMDSSTSFETVVSTFGMIMDIVTYKDPFTLGTTNACSKNPCSHFCYNTGNIDKPFTCGCPENVNIDPNNPNSCESSPCETNNGGCEHICTVSADNQVQCACNDFYELYNGNCEESYLLLATKHRIWKVSVLGDTAHEQTPVSVRGKVVALDYDSRNGRIFWTDTLVDAIFTSYISSNVSTAIVEQGLQTPDGIAYDWVTDTVYWTDMGTKMIGATTSDGSYYRTVVRFQETDKPRALVLDPKRGKMYFTDWGANSGIFSAWMDGSNLTQIESGNISWPNGLTIDRENQVLYWVDAKEDVLERVDTDGSNRKRLTSLGMTHSFALTFYHDRNDESGDRILKTDWKHKAILEILLSNTTSYKMYSDASQLFSQDQPFDIHWYSASQQIDTNDCAVNNGGCSHFCFYTPDGVKCACPENIQLQADNQTCVQDPCDHDNGGCQHTCTINEQGDVKCICRDWYKEDPDNSSACVQSELSMYVLERSSLQMISLDTTPLHRKAVEINPPISSGVSLDIDFRAGRIFWSDSMQDSIYSANLDGSDMRTLIKDQQVPDGIAVDWVAGNIYWTDTGPDKIYVANSIDGSDQATLKVTGLDRPRAILVSPLDRYLFWTDWGTEAGIGRASMDGTDQVLLVTTGLGWPNGLAMDFETKILYWVDALEDTIESVTINGENRQIVSSENIQHPYGFHFFDDSLYFTDWTSQSIKRGYKDGTNITSIMSFGTALMDITFLSPDNQMPGPCFTEGQPVPDYDILHNTFYIGFKGDTSKVNFSMTSNGTEQYLQLTISRDGLQLLERGTNEPQNSVSFPAPIYPGNEQDYIKFFYISHGVCYTRHGGKYLAGYTTGSRRGYRNLESAKLACQEYEDCSGVTYERDPKRLYKFTLRSGSELFDSADNEISWLQTVCANGKSETLTIGQGKVPGENKLMELTGSLAHTITSAEIHPSPTSSTWLCPGPLSPCGVDNGNCLGLCLVKPSGRSCACDGDLDPLGIKCVKHKHLLLSITNSLILFELGGELEKATRIEQLVQDESLIASIDFIYTRDTDQELSQTLPNDQVIWAEPNYRAIRAANADGTAPRDVVRQGGGIITSVGYDWVNKVIVWLDSLLGIFVSSLDGTHRVGVYADLEETGILSNAESLVVNPHRGEVYWTVFDYTGGNLAGVYCLPLRSGATPSKITTRTLTEPRSLTVDIRESVLYYSYRDGDNYYISALDIADGCSAAATEINNLMLPGNMAATKIDVSGDLLYLVDSSDVIQVNKYSGERVGSITVEFDSMLTGLKVIHKDQRPKGILERSCAAETKLLSCPVSGGVITRVSASVFTSPHISTCGAATSTCTVDLTEQISGLCVGESTCSIPLIGNVGHCTGLSGQILEVLWECDNGNTACDRPGYCDNGLCIADSVTNTPHCLCDEMLTFNETTNTCYHGDYEVIISLYGRLARYLSEDKRSTTIGGLNVLPGRAGGFSLVAARADNVYWWNNVTRALYSDTKLVDEDTAVVIAEDVDITSLDVDSAGQVWAVSKVTETQYAIRIYLPGYRATVLTGTILSHVRVVPSLRLLFYVEQPSSDQPVVVKKKVMDIGSDPIEIYTLRDGSINSMAVDTVLGRLYVVLDFGDIKVLDLDGNEQDTIPTSRVTNSTITSIVIPDKFVVLGADSGVHKIRKTGDPVKTIFKSASNTPLTVQLAYTSQETLAGCDECPYFCLPGDADAVSCLCPDGYPYDSASNSCNGLCMVDNGGCSQVCNVTRSRAGQEVSCSCHSGYFLAANGQDCLESDDFLLVNVDGNLYNYNTESSSSGNQPVPIVQGLNHFDFHYGRREMVWYNTVKEAIVKGNSTRNQIIHKDPNVTDVTSIAYDWAAENVYFIEGSERSRIGVVAVRATISKILMTFGLSRARYLHVHPREGLLVYTTYNGSQYEIQMADMDGKNRLTLYTLPSEPQGFALDTATNKVYWTNNSKSIMSGDLNRTEAVSFMTTVYNPTKITAYGDQVIWLETDGRLWRFKPESGVENIGNFVRGRNIEIKFYTPLKFAVGNSCSGVNFGCQEFCFGKPDEEPVCGCGGDVPLSTDRKSCGADPLLLVSGTTEVMAVNIKTKQVQTVLTDLKQAVIVDYDLQDQKYYWTDVKENKIYRSDMSGENREVVVENGLVTPDGMAVDWINRNLYWSDSHTSRFEVATLDGKYRRSFYIAKLDKPRGICVDPINSYIYWADWGTFPFIAKMELDGTNVEVLAQQGLAWPNSLSINLETGQLVWVDASRDLIGMMNVDGTEMQILSSSHVEHPFSIDQYLGTIFWSDWYKKSVMAWEYPDGEPTMFLPTEDELQHGIKVVHSSRQPSGIKTGCTLNNGGCSHLCFAKPDMSRRCGCSSHFVLNEDGVSCIEPDHRLLIARGQELLHVVLDPTNVTNVLSQTVLPIGNITGIVAFDFHIVEKRLIVGDTFSNQIASYNLDGTGKVVLAEGGMESVDGLAVDWISGNVFWTNGGEVSGTIEVVDGKGTARKVIVSDNLEKPRAIALDPVVGHVYWTDWGNNNSGIERVDMDGSNRERLISEDIVWPNGLVLDTINRAMYWTEANRDYIGKANLLGRNVQKIVATKVYQPFSITIADEQTLLWTDWGTNAIEAVKLNNLTDRSSVLNNFKRLMTIHHYDDRTQTGSNACANDNFGCSHLCLMTPHSGAVCSCKTHLQLIDEKNCAEDPCLTNNGNCSHTCTLSDTGVKCLCPDLFMLDEDGVTCRASEKSLLISSNAFIYRVTLDTPTPQVSYLNYNSISYSLALGYDSKNERVIYRDSKAGIVSVSLDGQDVQQLNDDWEAFSITVDNIAGNLYWVRRNVVKVSRVDGFHIRTLYSDPNHGKVTDIVVYPQQHYLFWTVQQEDGRGFVMRGGLDGSNTLKIDEDPLKPTGIAIDHSENKVYYVDLSNRDHILISMNMDGSGKRKLFQGPEYMFVDLAIDEGTVYWTQTLHNNLNSAKLPNFSEPKNMISYLSKGRHGIISTNVYDLVVVNATVPAGQSGCEVHDCEGLCIGQPSGTFKCLCEDDVPLSQTNKSRCGLDPLLLQAKRDSISSYDLVTGETAVIKDGLSGVSSVAYHSRKNLTLWCDVNHDKIMSVSPDGTTSVVVGHGIVGLKSIQVDHVTDKVYWLDSSTNNIGVADLSGEYQTILPLHNNTQIRAFAISPKHKSLYFAEESARLIYKAGMDGKNQEVLLESSSNLTISMVQSMVVDPQTSTLYWADSSADHIAALQLNGGTPVRIHTLPSAYLSSIAVFQGHIYMAERIQEKVMDFDLRTETTAELLQQDISEIKVNHVSLQPSMSSPCDKNNGGCHHLCLLSDTQAGFSCSCANGLVLAPDSKMCVEPELSLVVAGRTKLLKVPLDNLPATASALPFSAHASGAIALAVDVLNGAYFWTDVSKDSIVKGWVNGSGFYQEAIVTTDVKTPDGMVYDWVSQILYWSDTAMTHIQVCKGDGSSRKTLLSDLSKPRALAVDYLAGHLYWSEWGTTPRIARAHTDGTNMATLYTGDDVGWPNGMTLHHEERILYWADAKVDKLIAFDLKTNKKSVLLDRQMHPFGLAVWQDHLYWSDWQHQSVFRIDRHNPGLQETVISGWKDLMGLAVIHEQAQPTLSKTNCSYGNGADYRGTVATTISGRTCQLWGSQVPHKHSRTESNYPFAGLGGHNYCRNPDDEEFPWCYTTDPLVRWEYCSLKRCAKVRYEEISENMTFWDAQERCSTLGGNLATIRSEKESSFVRSKVNTDASGMVWIGLTKMQGNSTSEFTWLSGDGTQYKNFGDSFDRSLQSQWSVAMDVRTGQWYKYDSETAFFSICEIYSVPEGYTTEGNANGAMCSFPFYLNGTLRYSCQPTHADPVDAKFMCGTVALKNESAREWGFCHSHSLGIDGDNTVQEVVAYTDGVINNNILSPGRSCDTPVSNLTVVRNIDIQIQQVLIELNTGSVQSMSIAGTPCTDTRTVRNTRTTTVMTCPRPLSGNVQIIFSEGAIPCTLKFLVLENLAIGKPAYVTNPATNGGGRLAVDGKVTGRSSADCAESLTPDTRRGGNLDLSDSGSQFTQGPQFLRIDLGETKSVAQVLLYIYSNINPFEVRVGDSDELVWYANPACGGWKYKSSTQVLKRVNCGRSGRYLTVVVRDETKPISVCEVEVYADATPTYGGTANGRPCQHPFIADDKVHKDGCVIGGSEPGQEDNQWCYTVPSEDNQLWGYCQHAEDVNGCAFNNGGCSDLCFNTPVGVKCGCADYIDLEADGKTCVENACLNEDKGGCEQTCTWGESGRECGCQAWYKLNEDNITCSESELYLIGANKTTIFNLSVDSNPGALKVLVENTGTTIGVAYSQKMQLIFWTDAAKDAIFSANMDGTNRKIIAKEGIKSPDCIAYDWISDLIYWSDGKADTIEVASYDGRFRNIIVDTDMESPRGVALHPKKGRLYWTDWGKNPMIESSKMNGEDRRAIITNNIAWPNGITIDYEENKIIWVDAKMDTIESADLDGQNRRVIENVDVVHPFGATLYGDEIFWTDWGRKSVEAIHKEGTRRRTVYSGINQPMNIFAQTEQTGTSACSDSPCNDGICVPTSEEERVCMCERNVTPDMDNQGSCERMPKIYVALPDKILSLDVSAKTVSAEPEAVLQTGATSIDFDQQEEKIYIASSNSIYRVNFNGSGFERIFETEGGVMNYGFASIADICVDWIGRNIYYAELYSGNIYVSSMNGKYRTAVAKGIALLHSITLSLVDKEIIYSTWASVTDSGIFKVSMDGRSTVTKIHGSETAGSKPWGMLVDYEGRRPTEDGTRGGRLYWIAHEDSIKSSNMDGSSVVEHKTKKSSSNLINFLSVHQDQVYYFDERAELVASFSKTDNADTEFRANISEWPGIAGVSMIHPSQQPWVYSKCGSGKSPCEHLCLLTSETIDFFRCQCSLGYTEVKGHCVQDSKFAVMVTDSGLYEVNTNTDALLRQLPIRITAAVDHVHVNPVSQEIIFLDSYLGRIARTTFEGDMTSSLISYSLEGARELQVDYVNKLMFWINDDELQVADIKGDSRRTIIKSGMSKASELLLDSLSGVIRWIEKDGKSWKKRSTTKPNTAPKLNIRSAKYSGEMLTSIPISSASVDSLSSSQDHSTLIWVNKVTNTMEFVHMNDTSDNINVNSISPEEGTVTHVAIINLDVFYRTEVAVDGLKTDVAVGYLYKTSMSNFSIHERVNKIPDIKHLLLYDATQSFWRGEIKEIQSNDTLVDYPTASRYCQEVYQGTLAVIYDQDQNTEILQQLRGQEMWIGLSIKNYVWSWEGGPRSSYTNWAPQEPGNFVSVEGRYAVMGTEGKWFARGAEERKGFICERITKSNPCRNKGCSHLCLPSKSGATCACPAHVQLGSDGKTCQAGPCEGAGCEQGCYVNSDLQPVCTCRPGQIAREAYGKKTCSISSSALIIATSSSIVYRSLNASVPYVSTIYQSYAQQTTSLAVNAQDPSDLVVYFSDGGSKEVFRINKVGTENEEVHQLFREKSQGVTNIVDIAYDWLNERLYYVLETRQGYVIKWRKVTDLLVMSEILVTETNPITSIWLHNTYKFMYYTLSDGSVTRCSLEGKKCKVIYDPIDNGGYKVHAVTSDPRTKSIYLSTSSSVLKTDLEGKDPVTHVSHTPSQPAAVAAFGELFYWVEADTHADVVVQARRSAHLKDTTEMRKLYHAQLEYASTAQYETVNKIAVLDPDLWMEPLPEAVTSKSSIVAGVVSGLSIFVIVLIILVFVRLKRRGFTFLSYERLRRNDQTLMENMGDVTYDNPVYEFDEDDLDNPSERLVQLPASLSTSSAKNNNVEEYNMEVSLQGYENEYELSDEEHDTSIFDNDKI